jgi:hypothetical protein
LTGWFWYLGTMIPVIGLVQVGGQSMADRYSYVPFIGLSIMIAWSVADLQVAWRARATGRSGRARPSWARSRGPKLATGATA